MVMATDVGTRRPEPLPDARNRTDGHCASPHISNHHAPHGLLLRRRPGAGGPGCRSRKPHRRLRRVARRAGQQYPHRPARRLKCFSTYLAEAGIKREADDLYQDAEAWRGMSVGLLKGFRTWLLEQGYAIGTLNHGLAIIRQYCRLANSAGTIPDETLELLLAVKGYGEKTGRNLDVDRARRSVPTRKSTKKPRQLR